MDKIVAGRFSDREEGVLIDVSVPSLELRNGGPSRTVIGLCDSLCAIPNMHVRLVSQRMLGSHIAAPKNPDVQYLVGETRHKYKLNLGHIGYKKLMLSWQAERPALLHLNGLWKPFNHLCIRAARKYRVPFIAHPRGMLEPWALQWHSRRKKIALALYQRRDLDGAALLMATSEREAESLRRLGFHNAIAIIGNGINLENVPSVSGETKNKLNKRALFLGRLHPVKGLFNLAKAWADSVPASWFLDIAGPDEDGHLREFQELACQLGIDDKVRYLGELDDVAKWEAYENADFFVLPSFSENFGLVVAEALSRGVPVITTTGTPWSDLPKAKAGWCVEPTVRGLRHALWEATSMSARELSRMGDRGRSYVRRFDWGTVAEKTAEAYWWVIRGGTAPTFIHLD